MPDLDPTPSPWLGGDGDDDDQIHCTLIDLGRIPRSLWEQTLAPLGRQQRVWVALQLADEGRRHRGTTTRWRGRRST